MQYYYYHRKHKALELLNRTAMKGLKNVSLHGSRSSPALATITSTSSEMVTRVEPIITKWAVEGSAYAKITSLYQEGHDEARLFLDAVADLNRHMKLTLSSSYASRHDFAHAHRLMDSAMKRLQKEFCLILSSNRDRVDSVSSKFSETDDDVISSEDDFEIRYAGEHEGDVTCLRDDAMGDLRDIAECMVSCGYGKECIEIYKIVRKSTVRHGIHRVGFQKIGRTHLQKLDWEAMEHRIQNWLAASRIVVHNIFSAERILSNHVFGGLGNHQIEESCFTDTTAAAAVEFLKFPQLIASSKVMTNTKKSPERVYNLLDLYCSVYDLTPEIESIFSHESTSAVRSQATASLNQLAESIRSSISDFTLTVQNGSSSKGQVRQGGLHPLTRSVMDYVIQLSDYRFSLAEIFAGEDVVSAMLQRLLLVLLCKIDAKAEVYKDHLSLSYIFLANNLQYMVTKVKETNLRHLAGDDWITQHEEKVRSFVASYERLAWTKVMSALEEEKVTEFNTALCDACRLQGSWVVVNHGRLREEVLSAVKRKVLVPYMELYLKRMNEEEEVEDDEVRFSPEDVEEYMDGLFRGGMWSSDSFNGSDSSTSGSSSETWSSKTKSGFRRPR